MPNHLLIPLDRTPASFAVLPLVRALAAATGARITLLRVTPAWEAPNATWQDDEPTDLSQAATSLRRAGLRAEATIRRVMRGDQVALAIAGEARARRADLIVMATHVRAGPGRVARESVADQVLRLSPVPVLLLGPDGAQGDLPDTILAPVDGTPPGNAALELVASLARALKAEVVVLRVVNPTACLEADLPAATEGSGDEFAPNGPGALADAQHQVDWLATRLRGWGIVAQGRAVLGDLPNAILEMADRIAAGLIIMSTCARRAPAWSAPDGMGITVARRAHQPTLLVRHEPKSARPGGVRGVTMGAGVPA
jgi:nucleotide-binding universal stress UspA family protein